MDITAMEPCKGQVGKRNRKMGRLPEAVEGSKFDRPKELVVPRVLHDQLSKPTSHTDTHNACQARALPQNEIEQGECAGCITIDDQSAPSPAFSLERDHYSSNRHPAPAYCWSMIFFENRRPLFGIML
jgi:hypothetical protein